MKWYAYRGRKDNEWYSRAIIEAETAEAALAQFLEDEKFFPDTIEERGMERIAYRKGIKIYLRVLPKEPGKYRFSCIAGPGDYRGMNWIESIDADDPEQALRRLVKRHKFDATHLRKRGPRIIAFSKGRPFFLAVLTEGKAISEND